MIAGVQCAMQAGHMRVLISNDAPRHTPETWARETANAIVAIDPTSPRLRLAIALKSKMASALFEHFQAVRASSLESELAAIGRSATAAVFEAAKGSPWEIEFSQPDIRSAITETVLRNVRTAADLAVRTE